MDRNVDRNIDLLKNIKIVDEKKSSLLSHVAKLYENMLSSSKDKSERSDEIANIIIDIWILSSKIGIDDKLLIDKLNKRVKVIIAENQEDKNDLQGLIDMLKKY